MTAPYAPAWKAPSAPGQLSNTRGTNQGTDSIGFRVRMTSPKGAASPLGLTRMQAFRTGVGTNPSTSQPAWDSGWIGGSPAVQPLPVGKQACGGNSSVIYGGRMYLMPSDGTLMSSPVSSAAVGTWRYENPIPAGSSGTLPTAYAMTSVGSRLYCTASINTFLSTLATLYTAPINADGTVGSWVQVPGNIITLNDTLFKNTGLLGGWDGVSATGWIVAWHSAVAPVTYTVNISDGSITVAGVSAGGAPTVNRDNLSSAFIGNVAGAFKIFFVGGNATTASPVVDASTITAGTGLGIGTFAAKEPLALTKTGGTLITLQNGTVYYIGGAFGTPPVAANAGLAVQYATATSIFNSTDPGAVWKQSAQTLPTALWLAGGGITMPDYDLLATRAGLPDSVTEGFTGAGGLLSNSDALVMASFRAATTIAAVGLIGTFTTGSNTSVSPTFGQATVAGHLLVAWVSGSDETAGGATNLGETSAATFSYDYSGVNSDNEIATSANFTVPAGGIYINSISVYMGGHTAAVNTILAVWNASTGAVICNSGTFSAPTGRALRTQSVGSVFVAAGVTIKIGFWRDKSKDAEWGVASSGTFVYKTNQGSLSSISGAANCSSPYVCGHIQAYCTYSTLVQADITTAAAGWLRAISQQNTTEQAQIWYKPNCGAAETAPVFTSAQGSSPLYAQLAEFSGAVTSGPVDSSGGFAQGVASSTMTAVNGVGDPNSGDLILSASRWATAANGTASFSTSMNNATAQHAGDSGAASTSRHASFNYGIVPTVVAVVTRSPNVVVAGGQGTGGANSVVVYSAAVNPAATPSDLQAWSTIVGPGTAATSGNLGAGGLLVANPDGIQGAQDVTIQYGAQGTLNGVLSGTIYIPGLNDGDQLTVTAQVVGLDGDPSLVSTTSVKVGQAPTLSGILPTGAGLNGQPNVTFNYSPGAGGAAQATWRARIVGAGSGLVKADSGVRYDQLNSWMPTIAPMLDASETWNLTVTVTSGDTPMDSGSTNLATILQTFTVSGTAPLTPPSVSTVVSAVLGAIIFTWTNATGGTTAPVYNRLYWRLSGTPGWNLLKDFYPASVGGPQQVLTLQDQLPLSTNLDFAVSAIDQSQGLESVLSSPFQSNMEEVYTTTQQIVHMDPFLNLNALHLVAGSNSLASQLITMGVGGGYTFGHMDWGDATYTQRIKWVTGSMPAIFLRVPNRNALNGAVLCWLSATLLQVEVGFADAAAAGVSATPVNGTFYWLKLSISGSTITGTLYADSAGAIGSQIATVSTTTTGHTTTISPFGCAGIAEVSGVTGGCQFGGAFNAMCYVLQPVAWFDAQGFLGGSGSTQISGAGTDACSYCYSTLQSHSGGHSISVYQPTTNAWGFFQPGWFLPVANISYSVTGWVLAPLGAVSTNGPFEPFGGSPSIGDFPGPGFTGTGQWQQCTLTFTPTGGNPGEQVPLRIQPMSGTGQAPAGVYYFDDVSLNMSATQLEKITPPAESWDIGYAAMLHVVGSGTTLNAPLHLNGVVTADRLADVIFSLPANAKGPSARHGPSDYREITVPITYRDSSSALDAVLEAGRAGATLCFRDKTGFLAYVSGPMAKRSRTQEVHGPGGHIYYVESLSLTETGFVYTP